MTPLAHHAGSGMLIFGASLLAVPLLRSAPYQAHLLRLRKTCFDTHTLQAALEQVREQLRRQAASMSLADYAVALIGSAAITGGHLLQVLF